MDEQKEKLMNDIKQKLIELIELPPLILESYINESLHSICSEFTIDKKNIVLSVKIFHVNGNILFDELSIYDGNTLLFEIPINEKHPSRYIYCSRDIYKIYLSHF